MSCNEENRRERLNRVHLRHECQSIHMGRLQIADNGIEVSAFGYLQCFGARQ